MAFKEILLVKTFLSGLLADALPNRTVPVVY